MMIICRRRQENWASKYQHKVYMNTSIIKPTPVRPCTLTLNKQTKQEPQQKTRTTTIYRNNKQTNKKCTHTHTRTHTRTHTYTHTHTPTHTHTHTHTQMYDFFNLQIKKCRGKLLIFKPQTLHLQAMALLRNKISAAEAVTAAVSALEVS